MTYNTYELNYWINSTNTHEETEKAPKQVLPKSRQVVAILLYIITIIYMKT